jgi:hypothetical protein
MSNQNGQPTDLNSMVRSRRGSNNRHTTLSARQGMTRVVRDVQPWIHVLAASTAPLTSNNAAHIPNAEDVRPNANSAAAPPTSLGQSAVNPAVVPCSACDKACSCDAARHPINTPYLINKAQELATEKTTQQSPSAQPKSPASSFVSPKLDDIDLRSPADDPDYDFIDASEAMHSAHNAQPDRPDKYPELGKGSNPRSEQAGTTDGADGGDDSKIGTKQKKQRRGWFSLFA